MSLEDQIIVFVNPVAGGGRAKRHLPQVREVLERGDVAAKFIETTSNQEMQDLAARAVVSGARTLAVMGGDGTAQGLVQEAANRDVTVGIIPTGGGNDFAAALGIPCRPTAAAKMLLRARPRLVDVLQARTADGKTRIYLGGGGIGLDAETALYSARLYRKWPGRARYVASALHAYCKFPPLHVCADFPGTTIPQIEGTVLLAAALNTATYGAGIRAAPVAKVDDGLLDLIMVEYLELGAILRLLPGLVRNGRIETRGTKRVSAPRVRLAPDRSCRFHGDGEIFGLAPVEIQVLPKAVRVLVPDCPVLPES